MSEHTTLSYDGHGINGSDEYRSRIATFSESADRDTYVPLFAAAPEMYTALKRICELAGATRDETATLAMVQTLGAIAEVALVLAVEA